jgi:hypothetical protein
VAKSTKSKGAKNGSGAEEDNMTGAADSNGKRVGDKIHRNLLECRGRTYPGHSAVTRSRYLFLSSYGISSCVRTVSSAVVNITKLC